MDSICSFKSILKTFVSQAITEILFKYYKDSTDNGKFVNNSKLEVLETFYDLNIIPPLLVEYINVCWEKFNKKKLDDEEECEFFYIINKLNKLKIKGKFIHNYCMFEVIWKLAINGLLLLLSKIDVNILRDFNTFKNNIFEMLDVILDYDDSKGMLVNYEELFCNYEEKHSYSTDTIFIHMKNLDLLRNK